jgi:hypothetical protein
MTLQELITDLKAAGANDNTLHLALNCYELGQRDEREACAKVADQYHIPMCETFADVIAADIRARGTACK